jgi:cell wall-associated NlpC family hydrolase
VTTPATTARMTPALRAIVASQALSWLGTPYHHHGRLKGVGVDCAMLLAEVYAAAGVCPPVAIGPGDYPHDWHLHRDDERFCAWLERLGLSPVQTPARGDIGVFRYGRAFSHGALVVDVAPLTVVHAYLGRGVILNTLDEEPLSGRPATWWGLPS